MYLLRNSQFSKILVFTSAYWWTDPKGLAAQSSLQTNNNDFQCEMSLAEHEMVVRTLCCKLLLR